MSETVDDMRAMKLINAAEIKERHAKWKVENTAALKASGIPFAERPEALLFRETGKPRVDFYPSTGRWRDLGTGRTHHGGAARFVAWYAQKGARP